ncbi:TBC1 domain family member 4-like, partial [Stegodyphus dumicola]|uniref:TBC1 domain family member 4-like n=1 Tax=Stegodyphus dumicola TaxID=202533 RepID=UPI0015B2F6D3
VLELFTTIREVTKEMFNQQTVAQPTLKTASGTTLDSVISSCQQYEVLYLGRIKVSGKRAPPSFIDDAVEKFRLYELEKARNQQNSGRRRHGSGASISSLPHNLDLVERPCENGLKKHSGSRENLSSSIGVSSCESISCKTSDTCSRICCDSCNEPQLQSPLSPLYSSEELDKFPKPDRSLVTHSQSMDIAAAAKMTADMKSSDAKCNLMPPSSLITHTQSLDAPGCADIVRDLRDIDPSVMLRDRVRSCSGDIPRTKQTSLPTFGHRLGSGDSDMRRPRAYTSPSPSSNRQCNRTMLFLIGRLEICLIGMDKKQMLLSKTFNDIAHCSQGVKHLDHFGFICRETTLSGADCYAGYIFRCQTEKVVDEMMQTLKLAFSRAHQNYQQLASKSSPVPKLIVCDSCPMHWFHMLCSEVEGLSAEGAHLRILHRLGNLPDADKEEIMVKFQNADFSDVQEQNEVLMMLLREFSEQKQLKHIHVLNNCNGKNDSFLKEKGSKLDSFRQKAKKSISSSLETIFKLTNRDESKESGLSLHDDIPGTVMEDAETFSKDPDSRSYREGSYDGDHAPSGRVSPLLTRPRSSTFSSSREIIHSCKKNNSKHEMHRNNRRPIMNIFMKSGQIKPQTPEQDDSGPKGSWRQAIFHRVQTNIHDDHERNHETESPGEKVPKRERKKTKEELRALWRKAIIEQILLIRMEKENKNLQVNQDAASYKRMKLNYEEITPCIKSAAIKWEEILNDPKQHEELMDEGKLMELVKTGVPRHKRGEIWQFLAEQHRKIWDHKVQTDIDLSIPYEDLLKQLTSHQHSILIDIGKLNC